MGVNAGELVRLGKAMPPTQNYRHGNGIAWTMVPFVAALGQTERALHAYQATFGILGILACAFLAVELGAGPLAASTAALLMATSSYWIVESRRGASVGFAPVCLATASLALWLKGARERRAELAPPAALALGCALFATSISLGWILGLGCAAALGTLPAPWSRLPKDRKRAVAGACAVLFLAPSTPTLLFLLSDLGAPVRYWTRDLHYADTLRSFDLRANLALRYGHFAHLLDWTSRHPALPAAATAVLGLLAARSRALTRRDAMPWIVFTVYFLSSTLSPTLHGWSGPNHSAYQMLFLLPLFWAAACSLADKPPPGPARRRTRWALAALLCGQGTVLARVTLTGAPPAERTDASDAARDLYAFFERNPERRPVFLGTNSTKPFHAFVYASKGRVVPGMLDDKSPDERWSAALSDSSALFVHEPDNRRDRRVTEAFLAQLAKRGLALREEAVIRSSDGAEVYRLLKPPAAPPASSSVPQPRRRSRLAPPA